ncbi:SnoaL-like protein [Prauserella shujinwangii]|uniref:SnoaL-like protein n=1 Tax=Prauserella shujinwangii TaxID=1453103 RepID=A0A2T0LPP9_9PSEU|nr:nuclear transport factor 2 family protein [Prauserella shujinwangii]PRX45136.1 SnoaL-like protein [Prauserella shujinwangii]
MTDHQHLAERYVDVWNTTDARRRRDLVERLFAPDATYTDPLGAVRGWDGIDEFIAGAQRQFAGMSFRLGGPVDGHHDTARFTWLLGADGTEEPVVIGFDVIVTEGSDRIGRVYGFLDKVPA